jgi:hypothetical protein
MLSPEAMGTFCITNGSRIGQPTSMMPSGASRSRSSRFVEEKTLRVPLHFTDAK